MQYKTVAAQRKDSLDADKIYSTVTSHTTRTVNITCFWDAL